MPPPTASHRIKRKLHHYLNHDPNLVSVRMRKSDSPPSTDQSITLRSQNSIQFFVRTVADGKTLVLRGNPTDTIKLIHHRIHDLTGIPVTEQRLIYAGKQLHSDHTLLHCRITNDAGLHLVGRLRSSPHPLAWQVVNDLVSALCRSSTGQKLDDKLETLERVERGVCFTFIKSKLTDFVNMIPTHDVAPYVDIFMSAAAPAALVMLYLSRHSGNKQRGMDSIQHFIKSLPSKIHCEFAPVVLEFCKLLRRAVSQDDPLYRLCRASLGSMVEYGKVVVHEMLPFVSELGTKLSRDLECGVNAGPVSGDVQDFGAFLRPLRSAVVDHVAYGNLVPLEYSHNYDAWYCHEVGFLYAIFVDLLAKVQVCLDKVEGYVKVRKEKGDGGWDQYLGILKELHRIAVIYQGAEGKFWASLSRNKVSLCYLIVNYAKRGEDYKWILERKDLTDFESRRHLVMMLLPEAKVDYEEIHEMLIDRSQLLAESFEYIAGADPGALRSGLFMEFKNEEATGPGVLREWFFLVCQDIFNPQNALFLVCPNDRRRFFPNPASKVDPMHLRYFKFAGRVIALALMHKMQVGIVFDRTFFLQLGGVDVCLEDIKDADPYLYSSCKQILDMDACAVDEDALGLTFVWEVEELGSMKVLELVPDGKQISVNSRNRKEYVDLIIKHRFVTSVSQQVTEFARGFSDIVTSEEIRKLCFKSLVLQDLDGMLHGSESPISVDDWKAHTEYNGYKRTDRQINWFWKIVGEMTAEQRKVLLFFWTSVKYLPVEGFRGLASRLYIYKSNETTFDRLPSSHTCFFRICFPAYPSKTVMRQRLNIITQEHVGCSFGTW